MERPYVDWKKSVLWKRIDVDNFPVKWKYQCVDLVKWYMKFLWYKIIKTGNADELRINKYWTFDKSREQIKWTKNLMQWDIIVRWTKKGYHVAIFDHKANWRLYVVEQNWSWINSGSWLWANSIREKDYPTTFWTWIWRCRKVYDNLSKERAYIDNKLKTMDSDKSTTLDYKASIRVIW